MEWWRLLGRLKSLICILPEIYLVAHTIITCGVCFVKARNKSKNMNCLLQSSASTDSHTSKHSHFCWTDYVFFPLFYLFWQLYLNKYPCGSSLTCLRVVISINNIVPGLKTTSFFCQLQSHLFFQRVKKRRRKWSESYQLVISVNSHLVRLMDNSESSFLTKTEGMSNFLSCSWKFFGACCQCAEVKPRGWTQNRWGLHETWSLTVPCHFYFSFQFSGWCWITSLIKFS